MQEDLAAEAVETFRAVVEASPGMRSRDGQLAMVSHVAECLSAVTFGDGSDGQRRIAIVSAGTGVGKSLGYAVPGIAIAQAKGCKLVISTATTSLQTQLLSDLGRLSKTMPKPFTFGLIKGRGRYFCGFKAAQLAAGEHEALFDDDQSSRPDDSASKATSSQIKLYRDLQKSFAKGSWDGDKDSLTQPIDQAAWHPVAADRHTCTGKNCPDFQGCAYFRARRGLATADVLVANHSLVLSSLEVNTLPSLGSALYLIDEAHALPEISLESFATEIDLTRLRWLDRLPKAIKDASERINYKPPHDVPKIARELKTALQDSCRMTLEYLGSFVKERSGTCRFERGVVPEFLYEPLALMANHSDALMEVMRTLADGLREEMKESSVASAQLAGLYAKLGALAPSLEAVAEGAAMMVDESGEPIAKWCSLEDRSGHVAVSLHASPCNPGPQLARRVWAHARGVVLTSATLKACGSFEYFLEQVGLAEDADTRLLEAKSPFDYERQARLVVVETKADPKQVGPFNDEVAGLLAEDLATVERGGLVLFTSRAQMAAVLDRLPGELRAAMLVQGELSHKAILETHRGRVAAGQRSVIAGLASFGTGVDLPREELEALFIVKLPFAPPSDCIGEARAEWLADKGRDAFDEQVVPATGVKMLQWTGRAIRTETDRADVVCYDRRLLRHAYGRRILSGLPAYPIYLRAGGVLTKVQPIGRK